MLSKQNSACSRSTNLKSMSLWPLPVSWYKLPKNDQNIQKQKQDDSLEAFLKLGLKCYIEPKSCRSAVSLTGTSSKGRSPQKASKLGHYLYIFLHYIPVSVLGVPHTTLLLDSPFSLFVYRYYMLLNSLTMLTMVPNLNKY